MEFFKEENEMELLASLVRRHLGLNNFLKEKQIGNNGEKWAKSDKWLRSFYGHCIFPIWDESLCDD